jgi:hypothetical protein
MEKHVTLVGIFHIGLGALGLVGALIAFLFVVGGGLISGEPEAMVATTVIGSLIALVVGVLSVPAIVGGIGLLRYKPWARILVMILAVIDLFNVPIGTAVGIYTLWVLLQDETAALFGVEPGPPEM